MYLIGSNEQNTMHVSSNDKEAYLGGGGTVGTAIREIESGYPPDNKHQTYRGPMIRYFFNRGTKSTSVQTLWTITIKIFEMK